MLLKIEAIANVRGTKIDIVTLKMPFIGVNENVIMRKGNCYDPRSDGINK